jgi:hypothetical protein
MNVQFVELGNLEVAEKQELIFRRVVWKKQREENLLHYPH